MARFIDTNGLASKLRRHDWTAFARGYNGPGYATNHYDVRLTSSYRAMSTGGAPDLVVRAAQAYLTFLGHDPHGIDGVMGRMTRAAVNDFQLAQGLPATTDVDAGTLAALREAAGVD